jgi:hypothetical protein
MRISPAHLLLAVSLPALAAADEASPDLLQPTVLWLTRPSVPADQRPAVADDALVTPLDKPSHSPASELAGRFEGATVLAAAIYRGVPATMASDLSQQLAVTEAVPALAVAPLVVDKERYARADKTAGQWVGDLLKLSADDHVGVCVLWFADAKTHSLLDGTAAEPKLVLVLFKAAHVDGKPVLKRFAWGPVFTPTK